MHYNVYRTSPDGTKELCFKKQYQIDTVEFITGEMIGDSLPAIMSSEANLIYNRMRFLKSGETFQYNEFLIEKI
jgi:hypothetical protein